MLPCTMNCLTAWQLKLGKFTSRLMCVSGNGTKEVIFVNATTVSSGTLDAEMCDVQGAVKLVQGVFMGGFEEARFGIRTGSKQSDQFRYVLGGANTCHVVQPLNVVHGRWSHSLLLSRA